MAKSPAKVALLHFACALLYIWGVLYLYYIFADRSFHRGFHKDGSLRYVVSHGEAQLERDGRCFGADGFSRDLDDKELADIILRDMDNIFLPGCDDEPQAAGEFNKP